jgi:hypothetical protein
LPKYLETVKRREEEIGKVIQVLEQRSQGFRTPKLVLIGGYALRAYVPYNRATRDCDFVVEHSGDNWNIETIKKWLSSYLSIQTIEVKGNYGYLRMIKPLGQLKNVKISLDIMEGEVRGREKDDIVKLGEKFFKESEKADIVFGENKFKMYVPSYTDYLVLKLASGRPSDIRDIATLLWKKGMPKNIEKRIRQLIEERSLVERKLEIIVEEISNPNFVDSCRGTFASRDFGEKERLYVLKVLQKLQHTESSH